MTMKDGGHKKVKGQEELTGEVLDEPGGSKDSSE